MEIFEPKNFFDMVGVFTNILTAAVAVVGLLIALKTYEVANKALGEWKIQKSHDIDDEAIINMSGAIDYLRELRDGILDIDLLEDHEKKEANTIKLLNIDFYSSFIKLRSYWNVQKDNEKEIRFKGIALKVFRISNDDEIVKFYKDYIFLSSTIFSIVMNYYGEIVNKYNRKYYIEDEEVVTEPSPILVRSIPKPILAANSGKSTNEILFIYFTGNGLDRWISELKKIEHSYFISSKNKKGA